MNHENSVSENFLGEERNFPRFGPGIDPSPPSAARALIPGPHRGKFRSSPRKFSETLYSQRSTFSWQNGINEEGDNLLSLSII